MTRKALRKRPAKRKKAAKRPRRAARREIELGEIESMRGELERVATSMKPSRWNADPDDVRRSVVKLVLTLVDFIRQLLERQAIRRVGAGTLTADETEAVGLALMRLEETIRDLCRQFDLTPEELNLRLGPLGTLAPPRTESSRE